MHCAAAMCRNFHWSDVNLWASELPADTVVVLGGRDNMIPVAEVRRLLASPAAAAKGVRVIYEAERSHGAFLLDGELQDRILLMGSDGRLPAAAAGLPPVPAHSAAVAPSTVSAAAAAASLTAWAMYRAPAWASPLLLRKQMQTVSGSMAFPFAPDTDPLNEGDEDARDYAAALMILAAAAEEEDYGNDVLPVLDCLRGSGATGGRVLASMPTRHHHLRPVGAGGSGGCTDDGKSHRRPGGGEALLPRRGTSLASSLMPAAAASHRLQAPKHTLLPGVRAPVPRQQPLRLQKLPPRTVRSACCGFAMSRPRFLLPI